MRVVVRNNKLESAIRQLRRKLAKESIPAEIRKREAYEKPSEARRRKHRAAVERQRKADTNADEAR